MTKLVYSNGDYVHINEDPVNRTIDYSHGFITEPHTAEFDGLTLFGFRCNTDGSGPWQTLVHDMVFDFRDCPHEAQDEVISLVCGANVTMYNCAIFGGIKAILAGNGDYSEEDQKYGLLDMHNCFIGWSGRRCPEAQDGMVVYMENCWVHDWGSSFDTKAFGAYARDNALIRAHRCLFTQSAKTRFGLGLVRTAEDLVNHLSQAMIDHGIKGFFHGPSWIPGIARGLYRDALGDNIGTVRAKDCYRNRGWIHLGDGSYPDMAFTEAHKIAGTFDSLLPLRASEQLGMKFTTLFESVHH